MSRGCSRVREKDREGEQNRLHARQSGVKQEHGPALTAGSSPNPVMMTSRIHQPTESTLTASRSWCVLTGLYLDCPTKPTSSRELISRQFVVNQEAGS